MSIFSNNMFSRFFRAFQNRFSGIIDNLLGSLDNKPGTGWDAGKITALYVNILIGLIDISWIKHAFIQEKYEHLIEILIIHVLYGLICLSIVKIKDVKELLGFYSKKKGIVPEKQDKS